MKTWERNNLHEQREAIRRANEPPQWPAALLDAHVDAGWKHAEAYDDDDRQDIKTDVFNAFQAGVTWERRRALAAAAAPEEAA